MADNELEGRRTAPLWAVLIVGALAVIGLMSLLSFVAGLVWTLVKLAILVVIVVTAFSLLRRSRSSH